LIHSGAGEPPAPRGRLPAGRVRADVRWRIDALMKLLCVDD
jgi:hypothetical protein